MVLVMQSRPVPGVLGNATRRVGLVEFEYPHHDVPRSIGMEVPRCSSGNHRRSRHGAGENLSSGRGMGADRWRARSRRSKRKDGLPKRWKQLFKSELEIDRTGLKEFRVVNARNAGKRADEGDIPDFERAIPVSFKWIVEGQKQRFRPLVIVIRRRKGTFGPAHRRASHERVERTFPHSPLITGSRCHPWVTFAYLRSREAAPGSGGRK